MNLPIKPLKGGIPAILNRLVTKRKSNKIEVFSVLIELNRFKSCDFFIPLATIQKSIKLKEYKKKNNIKISMPFILYTNSLLKIISTTKIHPILAIELKAKNFLIFV